MKRLFLLLCCGLFGLHLSLLAQEKSSFAPGLSEPDLIQLHELVAASNAKVMSSARFLELAEDFSVLAEKYPKEWLPTYYTCLMTVGSVFDEVLISMPPEEVNKKCDLAEEMLLRCDSLGTPADAVLVIRALISYGRIRGGGSIAISNFIARAALEEARDLNPLNPRAYSLLGQSVYFTPPSAGGGPANATAYFETALSLFESMRPEPGTDEFLLPHWGTPRATRYYNRCRKGEQIVYDERMKSDRYQKTCY